jgi:5'-phosphate synthase pdxT subunit
MRAGVLALQGSSEPHLRRLADLGQSEGPNHGIVPVEVRQKRQLEGLTHLILPGGESTTIRHLLDLFGLTPELVARSRGGELCLYGTCAGAILLGQDDGTRPARLGLLDATLTRNAYGRQVDSFARDVELKLEGDVRNIRATADDAAGPFHCVFIRAPRFVAVGSGVDVLGSLDGEPILVEAPGLLAGTFHPELTRDLRVHRHFLAMQPAARSISA